VVPSVLARAVRDDAAQRARVHRARSQRHPPAQDAELRIVLEVAAEAPRSRSTRWRAPR
jgi:hypothetical protein